MELRHLRYFVAVAEERHFGRAAERLFMAQPPLSQQIRQLEEEIGVRLFERTSRRVALTSAGEAFLADARAILARANAAVTHARRVARGDAGWLSVGFVGSAIYDVLPAILRAFRERYPDVEVELRELLGSEQNAALREGRIHVGFARVPPAEEGIVQETVAREPIVAALPAGHPLTARESLPISALAGEPFVLFPPVGQSEYAAYVLRLCAEAGFTPRVTQEAGEVQTAVSLVAAGIGVALVPGAVQNLRRDGVAYRPLASPAPEVALMMSYRENDPSPPLPRFLEVAREVSRPHPRPLSRSGRGDGGEGGHAAGA